MSRPCQPRAPGESEVEYYLRLIDARCYGHDHYCPGCEDFIEGTVKRLGVAAIVAAARRRGSDG